METTKEMLHQTVDLLNETEAKQVLEYAGRLHVQSNEEHSIVSHPAIKMPALNDSFVTVIPILMRGVPASEQLINDRR